MYTLAGRLAETDLRTKASKLLYVGDAAEVGCLEGLVGLMKTLFRSMGMQDSVSSADLSDQLMRGVLNSVRSLAS